MKRCNRLMAGVAAALAGGALLAFPPVTRACPNCRELVADNSPHGQGSETGGLARGFNNSIYLMMSVPFLLMGSFGVGLWYVSTHNTPGSAPGSIPGSVSGTFDAAAPDAAGSGNGDPDHSGDSGNSGGSEGSGGDPAAPVDTDPLD